MKTSSQAMVTSIISMSQGAITNERANAIADSILDNSLITGLVIKNQRGEILASKGEPLEQSDDSFYWQSDHLSDDWERFEFGLTASDIGYPYHILVKIDCSELRPLIMKHAQDNLITLIVLSTLVTMVLMVILSRWLLDPILSLRENLERAAEDPENPENYLTSFNSDDEVGVVVRSANQLIYQNAENLKKMKLQAKDTIHQLAYFDTLTGLPNRAQYLQHLEKTIYVNQSRKDKKIAVAVIDLDHFKDINDTKGHHVGDQILSAVGQRLKSELPKDTYVSRTGEDEFAILCILDKNDSLQEAVAGLIFSVMKKPFKAIGENFQVKVSLGIASFPDDGSEASKLLKSADIALNKAKQEGRDTVRYYSADWDQAVSERFNLLRDMRTAIENKDFQLFYQPQLDLKTGKFIAAEALIRWFRREEGKSERTFVSPMDFIPLAEQTGLIIDIGRWVLEEAAEKLTQVQERFDPNFRFAVNISAIQMQDKSLLRDLKRVLEQTEIDPKTLELEVTETVFMDDVNRTISSLNAMKEMGVELAIDDFGTGYSNLSYLRQFPIDRLKIDQSFIRNALENQSDAAIAKTVIRLGQALGLKVIAEGVETSEHVAFLKAQDCDEVQGYFYAKPMPFEALVEFLNDLQDVKKLNDQASQES